MNKRESQDIGIDKKHGTTYNESCIFGSGAFPISIRDREWKGGYGCDKNIPDDRRSDP